MTRTFKPNSPEQEEFIYSLARFVCCAGGVGSGKTASGAIKAIRKIDSGEDGIVVGPDFPHFAKSTWPEFSKWMPWSRCTNSHLEHPYTQQKVLKFSVRGKEVKVYYGGIDDPTSWTGPNVNWCWFDEGARKDSRLAFDILAARCRIGKDPQLFITTTPRGINHWLYEVFVKGVFREDVMDALREAGYTGDVVKYYHVKTSYNKENLDPFTYLMLTGIYDGAVAQQELEGAFISLEGAVWSGWKQSGPYANVTEDAEYHGGVPVEWWVDDGFTEGHPRVILMAQVIPPYVNVFAEHISWYQFPEDDIKEALAMEYERPSVAYIDSSAAELRSRLWASDIDTVKASHNVDEGIKHTAAFVGKANGKGYIRFHPRCEFSIKELPMYTFDSQTGKPKKESDNVSDAMRYGLWPKSLYDLIALGAKYRPEIAVDLRELEGDRAEVVKASIPVAKVGPEAYMAYLNALNAVSNRSRIRWPGQSVRPSGAR